MDTQARKKAVFRAKLNQKKEKQQRINSPLVRYNEFDQALCRVCDLVLKSQSQWDAHQASRKHHQAISNIKASAAGVTRLDSPKPQPSSEPSSKLSSSVLPSDFFDNKETKKPKTGKDSVKLVDPNSSRKSGVSAKNEEKESENNMGGLPNASVMHAKPSQPLTEKSMQTTGSETKQMKGALPEGFFDNKEADLRARGIQIVKPDVKDEYKEFEKLIQEDLQEVDDRMEEEEIDAAETIEEYESVEQKAYRERVEMLKKKKMELEASKSAKCSKSSEVAHNKSALEGSSSDDDDEDENFAVDWRAQHL